jgi:hypothetical protein
VFNSAIHYYTATTENVTNTVTSAARDSGAVVTATLNGTTANLASALTWVEGQNVVAITVTNGGVSETYVLVVNKTTA